MKNVLELLAGSVAVVNEASGKDTTQTATVDADEEIFHLQADGFWGQERGFHDVEELWRQRQQKN